MTYHLPECFSNKLSGDSRHCICTALRDREERMLHLPECWLGQPCLSSDGPEHVMQGTIAGVSVTVCGLCMEVCICFYLLSYAERIRQEERNKWSDLAHDNWQYGWEDGLDAAREAVKGVNWFDNEGKMLSAIVATADSLAAIKALREEDQR